MQNRIKQALISAINLLIPRFCPVCNARLMPTEEILCISCMCRMPLVRIENSRDNTMIRTLWPNAPIEHALSFMHYRHSMPHHKLVTQFKYMKNAKLAQQLGKLAAQTLAKHKLEKFVDVIVPVPLSWQRYLQRGYNQAEWLAKGVAEVYQLPVCTKLLFRVKHGKRQTRLKGKERRTNAKGLYKANIPAKMKGKHFLLVDDVCTTGATLSACAQAILESAPTARVSIFALAWA